MSRRSFPNHVPAQYFEDPRNAMEQRWSAEADKVEAFVKKKDLLLLLADKRARETPRREQDELRLHLKALEEEQRQAENNRKALELKARQEAKDQVKQEMALERKALKEKEALENKKKVAQREPMAQAVTAQRHTRDLEKMVQRSMTLEKRMAARQNVEDLPPEEAKVFPKLCQPRWCSHPVTQPTPTSEKLVNLRRWKIEQKKLVTEAEASRRMECLRKSVELDQVDRQLALKRQEFQTLSQRRDKLVLKHQMAEGKAMTFERFVEESEVKRRRAMKKYQTERELNIRKRQEIEDIVQQLMQLKVRQQKLTDRVAKYKSYEDYFMKLLDHLPESYLDYGTECVIMPLIRRHETLSVTNQALEHREAELAQELERGPERLDLLKQQHNTGQLKLSELQSQLKTLKEQNKQREMNLLMDQGHQRDQVEEVASLVIAVQNLGDQCYLNTYGPLEDMDLLRMMDMVKEYILETRDTKRKATRLK